MKVTEAVLEAAYDRVMTPSLRISRDFRRNEETRIRVALEAAIEQLREELEGDEALLAAYIAGVGHPADWDAARSNARPFIEAALSFVLGEKG